MKPVLVSAVDERVNHCLRMVGETVLLKGDMSLARIGVPSLHIQNQSSAFQAELHSLFPQRQWDEKTQLFCKSYISMEYVLPGFWQDFICKHTISLVWENLINSAQEVWDIVVMMEDEEEDEFQDEISLLEKLDIFSPSIPPHPCTCAAL